MNQANFDEPDSNFWYAFGRIAEQYGEIDVAKADYAHVEKPGRALDVPASAYVLAQSRLKVLNGSAGKKGSGKE